MAKKKAAKIIAIKQSPLNAQRWCCDLDCGHDQWIGGKRRPSRKTMICHKCPSDDQ